MRRYIYSTMASTVTDMLSDDYIDRLAAEYGQLRLRQLALADYINDNDISETDILCQQYKGMDRYLRVLLKRLKHLGVCVIC